MKVLVLSQYWQPENGVPHRRWRWFAEILNASGHEVVVVAPPAKSNRSSDFRDWIQRKEYRLKRGPEVFDSGETVFRSPYFPASSSLTSRIVAQMAIAYGQMFSVWKLRADKRLQGIDLIIGTVPALPTALVTFFAGKILRRPYVIDLRDAWPDLLNQASDWNRATGRRSLREKLALRGPFQVVSVLAKFILNEIISRACVVITTSRKLGESLESQHPALRGRVHTIVNVFPPATDYRKQYEGHCPAGALKVLYAGTIGRAQNLSNAVKAVAIANRHGHEIHIRFVGAGAAKADLISQCKELGVEAEFYPLGSQSKMGEHYAWADTALVHLTDWEPLTRTIPSKIFELMNVGVHITAVVRGESAGLVSDLRAGIVVPPEEPETLAAEWIRILKREVDLQVDPAARNWVYAERSMIESVGLTDALRLGLHDAN